MCYCLFIDFLAYYENLTTKSKLNWRLNNSSVNAEMCVFWSICTKRTCSGLWLKSLRAQRVLTKTQTQKIVFTFLCRYKWSKWLKSSWMVNFRDWHEVNFSICGYYKRNLKDYIFLQLYFRHVHLHSRVELLVPFQKMAASSTKSNLDLLILAGKYGGFNVYRKILGLLCKS